MTMGFLCFSWNNKHISSVKEYLNTVKKVRISKTLKNTPRYIDKNNDPLQIVNLKMLYLLKHFNINNCSYC